MPDNPNNWFNIISRTPPEVLGALLAMGVAALRVVYDKEETKPMRIIMEALICGLLSLTGSSAIIALGLNIQWAIFSGGVIGYMGSSAVRIIALNFINRKVGDKFK